jgi:hypothetical protein
MTTPCETFRQTSAPSVSCGDGTALSSGRGCARGTVPAIPIGMSCYQRPESSFEIRPSLMNSSS